MVALALGQVPESEFRQQLVQRFAVQHIENGPWPGACAHALHLWLVKPAPLVRQQGPVGLGAVLLPPAREIADDAAAPIHDGAEYVKDHGLDG